MHEVKYGDVNAGDSEMVARSHSRSALLGAVLFGPIVRAKVYARGHVRVGDYVVAITSPGAPRMPNGVECELSVRPRARVAVGAGRVVVDGTAVNVGPEWDCVPASPLRQRPLPAGPEPLVQLVSERPAAFIRDADAVVAGYVAGIALLHGQVERAARIAEAAAARTTPLAATLLRHAAAGEVPEVLHTFFATGDPQDLLHAPGLAGHSWIRGLISAGYPFDAAVLWGRVAQVRRG